MTLRLRDNDWFAAGLPIPAGDGLVGLVFLIEWKRIATPSLAQRRFKGCHFKRSSDRIDIRMIFTRNYGCENLMALFRGGRISLAASATADVAPCVERDQRDDPLHGAGSSTFPTTWTNRPTSKCRSAT
ncbi:hypothetical protein [Ralstonia pseudosolanacearum]|uniref:hypothetical protein n=1 Tax=Ralstonia pseudosolanacearum TaxID=1310165 RepID=UPI001FF9E6E7|nr:hypothetical protein [Ralstonia pseudosolanacearum]